MKKLSDIARAIVPPYQPCESCQSGWVKVKEYPGAEWTVARCMCWRAHQERVAQAAQKVKP